MAQVPTAHGERIKDMSATRFGRWRWPLVWVFAALFLGALVLTSNSVFAGATTWAGMWRYEQIAGAETQSHRDSEAALPGDKTGGAVHPSSRYRLLPDTNGMDAKATRAEPPASPSDCTRWRVVESPNAVNDNNHLWDVAALSSNNVWAVGDYHTAGPAQIQHWDGSAWTIDLTGTPGTLQGISAASANDIWAVGHGNGTLTMHWNGSIWSQIPSPSPGATYNEVWGVAARATNDVWAVGHYDASGVDKALIMHWDGSVWGVADTPAPPPNRGYYPFDVAALAANDVWVVGDQGNETDGYSTLVMHWNGSAWGVIDSPHPTPGNEALRGITAVAPNDIWAVGAYASESYNTYRPLTMHYDGNQWQAYYAPRTHSSDVLYGVKAIASGDVWAVGGSGGFYTFTMHWDGNAWSTVSSPSYNPDGNELYAVAASATDDVWAVGTQGDEYYFEQETLVERYGPGACPSPTRTPTPTDTPQPTPSCGWRPVGAPYAGSNDSALYGVEAINSTDIWAVGTNNGRAFASYWNGSAWTNASVPSPGTFFDVLYGVIAVSSSDIWAVGSTSNGLRTIPLTIHWNGTAWSLVSNPVPPVWTRCALKSVTALASTNVWAVGYFGDDTGQGTLTEHWNGSQWDIVVSPNPSGSSYHALSGVSAVSPNDIWAVGESGYSALTLHWNGTAWASVQCPLAPELLAVAAVASNDVWAVGGVRDLQVIMHWDGAAWTLVPGPTGYYILKGITALTPSDIWATGDAGYTGGELGTIHWDGASWVDLPFPRPSPYPYTYKLNGIAAASPSDIWTVGQERDPMRRYSMHVERNPNLCFVPTSTPTRSPTPTVTATPTPRCPGEVFSDVCPSDYFYTSVMYLYNHGVVSGYADGSFHPYNNTTRGQLTKIVVLAEAWPIATPSGTPTFSDVPASHTFYPYVETAVSHSIISGYADGTFQPGNNVTRGQLCKIVVLAEGWTLYSPPTPTFTDVPPSYTFYSHIETAYSHQIISGYSCGAGCLQFLPGNNATRGQISKIVYNAVTGP